MSASKRKGMGKLQGPLLFLMLLYLQAKTCGCSHVRKNHSDLMPANGTFNPQQNITASGINGTLLKGKDTAVANLKTGIYDTTVSAKNTIETRYVKQDSTTKRSLDKTITHPSLGSIFRPPKIKKRDLISNLPTFVTASLFVTSPDPFHRNNLMENAPNVTTQNVLDGAETTELAVDPTAFPHLIKLELPTFSINVDENCTKTYSRSDTNSSLADCSAANLSQPYLSLGNQSFETVLLTTDDMEDCSSDFGNKSLDIKNILSGRITISSKDELLLKGTENWSKNLCIRLRSPPSTIMEVEVETFEEWMKNTTARIMFYPGPNRAFISTLAEGIVFQSSTDEMSLSIEKLIGEFQDAVSLRTLNLSLKAVPWCAKKHLQVECLEGNTKGLVQTPGWNGQNLYSRFMDSCVTITAPARYAYIMTSFIHMDIESTSTCAFDVLEVYLSPACTGQPISRICQRSDAFPDKYLTNVLSLRFSSDYSEERAGFRLMYSFHSQADPPKQAWDGRWQCSGPSGPVLVQHFVCMAEISCVDEEDKVSGCPPADFCGVDVFRVEGRCYRYISPSRKLTWTDARDSCKRKWGHLVSLNTEQEWRGVVEFRRKFTKKKYLMVGLQQTTKEQKLPDLYSSLLQWSDSTMAYYLNISLPFLGYPLLCAAFRRKEPHLTVISCQAYLNADYLCEITPPLAAKPRLGSQVSLPAPSRKVSDLPDMSPCRNKGSTRIFLQCEIRSHCYGASSSRDDLGECVSENPQVSHTSFRCDYANELVHYTLVCDHRRDCGDGSDEDFCTFPPCPADHFLCQTSKECLPHDLICDGVHNCQDRTDEELCPAAWNIDEGNIATPPAIINFSRGGSFTVDAVNISGGDPVCPETHFQCPGDGYCLPVYVRCNQVLDCPGGEDEADCESYTCPGFYRCHAARNCLHYDHVCDGQFQCPRHDDELMCNLTCPDGCQCLGYAFTCQHTFQASLYPQLRYLNADNTGFTLQDVADNNLLIFLRLRRCNIQNIGSVNLPNVHTLDLAYNQLHSIKYEEIMSMKSLRYLSLASNKQLSLHSIEFLNMTFPYLRTLDMSGGSTSEITNTSFLPFPHIQYLNLSRSKLQKVWDPGFRILYNLRGLDISHCPVTEFYKDLFKGLSRIEVIHAPKFKLCCPTVLPQDFNPNHCFAPADEVSSCEALLRADTFRVFLVMYALFALLGNFVSFMYRVFGKRGTKKLGFDYFVTHLCVADFLMGVYLAIVGIADRVYYGTYEWNDLQWKRSVACQTAGFLSLVSSEVSAFLICFITLERFLLIRFPHKNLRFTPTSARIACLIGWVIGMLLAAIPLLPFSPPWDFYSQTGICIPLPVTRKVFPGSEYSFYVMIVFNFVLFLLIAAGQFLIFWSIRSQRKMVGGSSKKAKDMAIARRLLAVVMSDFLCWFPIGLLGLLAKSGVPISGDANVAMAIIVLPFNSALNPFLYTFHMLVEQHRNARAQSQAKRTSKIKSKTCPKCNRCDQELSGGTTFEVTARLPDRISPSTCSDQDALILIETFLMEQLITPEYFHLKDYVIQIIRHGSPSSFTSGKDN